jgi:hypothetical protein
MMKLKTLSCLLLLAICFAACSNDVPTELPEDSKEIKNLTTYPSKAKPQKKLSLTTWQTYGDTDSTLIGTFTGMAVDTSGRVFIADRGQNNIKVYAPDGTLMQKLGRAGEGPKEFRGLQTLLIADGNLLAYDDNLKRILVFSLETLTHSRTVTLAGNKDDFPAVAEAYMNNFYVRDDGSLLTGFAKSKMNENHNDWAPIPRTTSYYVLDADGQITSGPLLQLESSSNLLVPYGPRSVGTPVDFMESTQVALASDNRIVTAKTGQLLLKVHSPTGKYKRAFYHPFDTVPLTPESAKQAGLAEHIITNMSKIDLPSSWPVIENMFIDEQDRIWVSTIVEDMDVYQWWVFSMEGKLISELDWPRSSAIRYVSDGKLYAVETNPETGIKKVVQYDILSAGE